MTDSSPAASPSSLKIYFRLLGYVRPYISLFLISIVGFLIAVLVLRRSTGRARVETDASAA